MSMKIKTNELDSIKIFNERIHSILNDKWVVGLDEEEIREILKKLEFQGSYKRGIDLNAEFDILEEFQDYYLDLEIISTKDMKGEIEKSTYRITMGFKPITVDGKEYEGYIYHDCFHWRSKTHSRKLLCKHVVCTLYELGIGSLNDLVSEKIYAGFMNALERGQILLTTNWIPDPPKGDGGESMYFEGESEKPFDEEMVKDLIIQAFLLGQPTRTNLPIKDLFSPEDIIKYIMENARDELEKLHVGESEILQVLEIMVAESFLKREGHYFKMVFRL